MEKLIAIVGVIFGILNLILFFKIWGMCDNVKRMTEHFCGSDNYYDEEEGNEENNESEE
jgi:hypothetical protein